MKKFFKHIPEILKHPLFILIVGAVIGSVLIPWINSCIDRNRRLREAREARAAAVLKAGVDAERTFALQQAEFESFCKEVAAGSATNQSRQELKERVNGTKKSVDWWWPYQTLDELRILRLLDDAKLKEFTQEADDYHDALLASTAALDPYWNELIHNKRLVSRDQAALTVRRVHPQLEKLGERRRQLLEKMVKTIVY